MEQITKTSHPLTQSQSLLWIGQQMAPNSPLYNMVMTYRIQGDIDIALFVKSMSILVDAIPELKSTFKIIDNIPTQCYDSSLDFESTFLDVSSYENPFLEYKNWEEQQKQQLFNLEEKVFDSTLIQLSDQEFIWYFCAHHLIVDAWSNTVLFDKLSHIYQQLLEQKEINVTTYPFTAYVAFEKESRGKEKFQEIRQYWDNKAALTTKPAPLYGTRAKSNSTMAVRTSITLGKERSEKIRELAQQTSLRSFTQDLTLYNIFLTALYTLIKRSATENLITIGTSVHNRTNRKFQNMLGYLVEVFPMVLHLEEEETFLSLYKKVQIETNTLLRYGVAGASSAALNRNFNVFYNYIHTKNKNFAGLRSITEWVHTDHHDAAHHLRLHVHDLDNSGEIQFYFDFNTSIFNEEKQKNIPQHFLKIIDAFIENFEVEVDKQQLITPSENRLLNALNTTSYSIDAALSIVSIFEKQVAITPDAIALIFAEQRWTYKELNSRANQLAKVLQQENITYQDGVAIWLKRSPEFVVSILAVLKTGAIYIPIPYNFPKERVEYILKNSQSKLLIGSNISEHINIEVLDITTDIFSNSNDNNYTNRNITLRK